MRAAVGMMLDRMNLLTSQRPCLALALHAVDPSAPHEPDVICGELPAYKTAVSGLYRSLGVADGTFIPNALRAQVLAALGFQEPPAPAWLEPGYRLHEPWRGARGEDVTVARVTSEGVVLRGQDGREEEPVPMGLFVARYPTPPPRLQSSTSKRISWQEVYNGLQAEIHSRTTYRCDLCGIREERNNEPAPQCGRCKVQMVALGGDIEARPKPISRGVMVSFAGISFVADAIEQTTGRIECTVASRFNVLADLIKIFEGDGSHDLIIPGRTLRARCTEWNATRFVFCEDSAIAPSPAQPKPAQHQVWRFPPLFVGRGQWQIDVLGQPIADEAGRGDAIFMMAEGDVNMTYFIEHGAVCIGVQLPDARNMLVGEAWAYDGGVPFRILCVEAYPQSQAARFRIVDSNGEVGTLNFSSVRAIDTSRWHKVTSAEMKTTAPSATPLPTAEGLAALRTFFDAIATVANSDAFVRDQYRRAIDAVLVQEGASRAERAAVVAACEAASPYVERIRLFLRGLRRYEACRTRGMTPARAALELGGDFKVSTPDMWSRVGLDVYERARVPT